MVKNDSLITYEKAISGQAVIKKFFIATFLERKIMSTKTSFKRIALVAASALAIAGFSAVPSNAAVGTPTLPVFLDAATSTVATVDFVTAKAAGDATYTKGLITGSMTAITTTAGSAVVFGVTASGSAFGTNDLFDLSLNGTVVASAVGDAAITSDNLTYTPAAAGTYTGNIRVYNTGTTRAAAVGTYDLPFTWTVTAASDLSTGLSTAYATTPSAGGATASATTNAVKRSAPKAANTGILQVKVTLLKADGTADNQAHVVTATATGVGFVLSDTTPNVPGVPTTRTETDNTAASVRYVHVNSDGTAGTGSVKITVQNVNTLVTTTLGTWDYTSTGSVTAIAVDVSNFKVGLAGGSQAGRAIAARNLAGEVTNAGALNAATTTPAFTVTTKDSAGGLASAAAVPTIVSANTLVVSAGTCVLDDGADTTYSSGSGVGVYNCAFTTANSAKSGDKTTLTVRIVDPADATKYLSATYDVTIGGSVSTEALAFDKATYATGESVVITITAKDSAGNPVADGVASPAVTFNKSVGGTYGASLYKAGARANKANTLFAPASTGDLVAFATSGNSAATALTATSTVGENETASLALDAANAATDAANNAYDEAQNATQAASDALAAVTALAAQVKTLIASVKALTAAVAKLKKK